MLAQKKRSFFGTIVRIKARLATSRVQFDTLNNPHISLPATGEEIVVSFPREAVLAFPEVEVRQG